MRFRSLLLSLALVVPLTAAAQVRWPDGIGLYVGIDARLTFPSGGYSGLFNPNHHRLTLLLDHGDHYHSIGGYSYTGPAPHPGVLDTSTNNRIPETFSGESPLDLVPGAGLYAGKLRTMAGPSEYGYLGIASVTTLSGFGAASTQEILYRSSANRWSASLAGAQVGLELLSATPGLKIGTESVANLFAVSDTILLGAGNTFEFKPVYWVEGTALAGSRYSAEFRLVNLAESSSIGDSGRFHFDFEVPAAPVPEPELFALLAIGLPLVGWMARRRRTA